MPKHVHAELMAKYAQDAMETDKPWERWECQTMVEMHWMPLEGPARWVEHYQYRRKPKTSRERFEEWASEQWSLNISRTKFVDLYQDEMTDIAWSFWQEAERQAKEINDENQ